MGSLVFRARINLSLPGFLSLPWFLHRTDSVYFGPDCIVWTSLLRVQVSSYSSCDGAMSVARSTRLSLFCDHVRIMSLVLAFSAIPHDGDFNSLNGLGAKYYGPNYSEYGVLGVTKIKAYIMQSPIRRNYPWLFM
jgi:hypothetical protein